jgi:polar amino acid transport system permease protein
LTEPVIDDTAGVRVTPAPVFPQGTTRDFELRVIAVWVTLFILFVLFFLSFGLKFSFILQRLPQLAGLKLTPDGFLQGAALTLFVCFFSIIASSLLGFISALGRLSNSAVL